MLLQMSDKEPVSMGLLTWNTAYPFTNDTLKWEIKLYVTMREISTPNDGLDEDIATSGHN